MFEGRMERNQVEYRPLLLKERSRDQEYQYHLGAWKCTGIQIGNVHFNQIPEGFAHIVPFEKPGVEEEVGSGEGVAVVLRRGLVLRLSW